MTNQIIFQNPYCIIRSICCMYAREMPKMISVIEREKKTPMINNYDMTYSTVS